MSNPYKLPYEEFLKSFKIVPGVAICLLLKDSNRGFLLTKRTIPPLQGYWHIPGIFLLKGEKLFDCIKRAAKEELKLNIKEDNFKLLGIFEDLDKDPRGHIIDIVYKYQISDQLRLNLNDKSKKFFKELPKNIGFGHEKILLYEPGR